MNDSYLECLFFFKFDICPLDDTTALARYLTDAESRMSLQSPRATIMVQSPWNIFYICYVTFQIKTKLIILKTLLTDFFGLFFLKLPPSVYLTKQRRR